ncbi:glycosyltransferase family 2 protein [Alteraurantiacibacter aquimixticola]|uniref:Glycosyltransferase family 2 protein n=1 Tax=Alteraurantiacibacter aquimixticola TaxID=2489173 RepID=A0A4T3F2B3_9SPHN|nr:glycosyltransferase family A protein [Alteraurantiacibacter aquimixticola]TIX51248.1 glycosyltransferase family 2 protein [Alteraurantiacibacter aquimixticola]
MQVVPSSLNSAVTGGEKRSGGAAVSEEGGPVHILLAVLTTGARDGSLRDCVEAISRLKRAEGTRLELMLVQNGTDEVTPEVARLRDEGPMPLTVVVEPRKGIPIARNRALEEGIAAGADYLAFIDDDAEPDEDWLIEAAKVLRVSGTHAVAGPQEPVFPPDSPERLRGAIIYKAIEQDPDRPCRWAASNNVIMSLPFIREQELRFDENFRTGGSDKDFFLRFANRGGVIRWAPKSIVREPVVPERLSMKWAIKRSWRLGTTGFQLERSTRSPLAAMARCAWKGLCYVLAGIALLPLGLLPRRAALVDGLSYIARGAGFFLGMVPALRLRNYA